MLIKIRLKGEEVYPSQIRGKLAFEKNVILLFRVQGRIVYVDYSAENLGGYEPPLILQGKVYTLEVVRVPPEYSTYIRCIAGEVERRVNPLFRNKKLACNNELTVVLE